MHPETDITLGIRQDRFDAMKFESFVGRKGSGVGKRLGHHWVFSWQFQTTWEKVCKGISAADWTKKQTAKSLFNDPEIWSAMKHGIRHAIGRCLRYFVDNGMLPLYVINPKSTGTKYYAPLGLKVQTLS